MIYIRDCEVSSGLYFCLLGLTYSKGTCVIITTHTVPQSCTCHGFQEATSSVVHIYRRYKIDTLYHYRMQHPGCDYFSLICLKQYHSHEVFCKGFRSRNNCITPRSVYETKCRSCQMLEQPPTCHFDIPFEINTLSSATDTLCRRSSGVRWDEIWEYGSE